MKLDVAVNEVILSNVGATGEFKIRNSAKAFKILSDGLYSNKIRAIVRELSCNAIDSHVAAGKVDVPFEVHLPTMLEPWFSVRDFGVGLDNDQVINVYTTYFESTKTDSNDFIGALGLGSKSPFSYTENFSVMAIKGGVKRIYSAFINEHGVPSIAEMSTELTDEPTGVEVKFSVSDRYDYNSFRNEAINVFYWFRNKPVITGVDAFTHQSPVYKETNIVAGVHTRDAHDSVALMGNIAYPLNNIPEPGKHLGDLATLLQCGLVLEFEIGELDFAASREQLSYIPSTIASIRSKLEQLNTNLFSHLTEKCNAISNEWDKAAFLSSEMYSKLYKAAAIKYVRDTKFPLIDENKHFNRKIFSLPVPTLDTRGLDIKVFRRSGSRTKKVGAVNDYSSGSLMLCVNVEVDPHAVFVLNDLKGGCYSRAFYHYTNTPGSATVYCLSYDSPDVAIRQEKYDDFLKELHSPPTVVKASSLSKPVWVKPVSTQGIMSLCLRYNARPGYEDSYVWESYNEPIDNSQIYHFVYLNNYSPIDASGKDFPIIQLKGLMDQCGVKEISATKILGVRKSRQLEISKLNNWVWIGNKLREEIAKIADSHIVSLVAAEMIDTYEHKIYTNQNVAKLVSKDSLYAKHVAECAAIDRTSTGNVGSLVTLCREYGKILQVEDVRKNIDKTKGMLHRKYPLLKHLSSGIPEQAVADYITLIEKQGSKK